MRTTPFGQRRSGIPAAGELDWGSHFGVLYASERELFELLVPFIEAGLASNELCSWEVAAPLSVDAVRKALARALPDFERHAALGQIEIVSPSEDPALRTRDAIERRLDRAILAGFEGLRLVRHAAPGARTPGLAEQADVIGRLNVVAAFAYPREPLGAVGLMQVVQDHRFALICDSGRWKALEGSEAHSTRAALKQSEQKLQSLFANMSEGFAYHRVVMNAEGTPCDYVFLEVNAAFERLTGLVAQDVLGKRITQVHPGIESDPTDWIGKYARVALTGEPVQFESHSAPLDRWYAISAFCPQRGYFAITFSDITDRKRAEAERRSAEERLLVTLRSIGDAVIVTDTEGRVTLMNRVAEDLSGWSESEARKRPLGEVFRIVDEVTGAPAEDPVRKVIAQGRVVALANHTVLIARDGRRIPIADSAAPVHGGAGLLGVVLVFRDVTAVRSAEQERELTIEFLRLANENVSRRDLTQAAVTYFQRRSGCQAVGLRLKQGDDFPYYEARGFPEQFLLLENELCARDEAGNVRRDSNGDPRLECMCGNVICGRTDPSKPFFTRGGSFWANDTTRLLATTSDADRQTRTRNRCNGEGYESVALVPLRVENEQLGLLQLNDRRKGMFSPEAIALWERLAGYLGVALARCLTREQLEEREGRLRTLGDQIPSGAVYQQVLHPDGRVTYAHMSAGIESLFGISAEEVLADPGSFRRLIVEEDRERVAAAEARSARELATFHCEFRQRSVTGDIKWVQCRSKPRRIDDGSIVWDGVVVDVTESKRAEEERERLLAELHEAQRRLGADLDAMTRLHKLGSLFLQEGSLEPVLAEIVDAAIAISGADFGNIQILEPDSSTLRIVAHRGFPEWWLDFWNCVCAGQGTCGTALQRGERVIIEDVEHSPVFVGTPALEIQLRAGVRAVQSTPLLSRSGRPLGMFSTQYRRPGRPDDRALRLLDLLARQTADIIERAQTEAALRSANVRLLEADRRKNEFLAVLSHELRNPLAPISNSLHVLEHTAPGGSQARRAKEVIHRQVGHLSRLVDDLLDVTRVSRNKIRLQRRRFDLRDVVRRTVEDQRSLFERSDIQLQITAPEEPLFIEADATRVAQVVGNLLQNAAKFTRPGGFTCVSLTADPSREHALVEVRDNGDGMAPETLAGLFQPFMQADKTLDRSKGGLGLGLALVKGLVELHGGRVSAHSEGLGKGARFVVALPLDGVAQPATSPADQTVGPRRSRRVLIIEDNVDAADSLRDVLELGGHEVAVAYNGPDGITKARDFCPEVVLCDIGLPGMDGYDVARMLCSDATLRRTHLVALSGYALPEDLERARAAGFEGHLAKPPSIEALEQLLESRTL